MKTEVEFAKFILWACIEDYAGLWELLWEANTKFPAIPETERRRVLLDVMQRFIDRGLIELYRCKEPYGDLSEVETDAVRMALNEEKNWEAPERGSVSIRVGATEKGGAEYQSGSIDSFT